MAEEGAEMHRGGALLWLPSVQRQILLRLPPQPSSLPRASAVCRRWRRLTTDPKFHRRFYAHHREPPILGLFHRRNQGFAFIPILDRPDCIRFDLRRYSDYNVLGCRHGRVLAIDRWQSELLVCDPITITRVHGSVLCAAGDQGHAHGGCHSSPFKVVLMTMDRDDNRPIASVYSSQTGIWGDLIKTAAPCQFADAGFSGALVGNALYWLKLRMDNGVLVFDLGEQRLAMIRGPPVTNGYCSSGRIIQAEDGAVGFAVLSYPRFQMWQRNVTCHGVATWVSWKTIEMNNIPGLPPQTHEMEALLGYSQDTDAIYMYLDHTVHMVQLKLMQSKRLFNPFSLHAPSVY